jgi:hypothetical protein
MTVTFTAELGPIRAHVITCICRGAIAQAPRYGTYQDALADLPAVDARVDATGQRRQPLPGCTDPDLCPDYSLHVHAIEDLERPEINVSNANAMVILEALGYGILTEYDELFGAASAEEFRGRVLTALAVAPEDEGVPFHQVADNVFECGRRPGYLQGRLAELHELADWCIQHDRPVQWG